MASAESVSEWLIGLKRGESGAAQRLWERYFHQLVHVAGRNLKGIRLPGADAEDVALSAFAGFCQATREGRYPSMKDRDDLWRLLIRVTARKAIDQLRHEGRQKRGGGHVLGESAMIEAVGEFPTPEFAAMVAEESRRLLELLAPEVRPLAIAKLEGYTNHEIAGDLGCSISTVERKLRLIRKTWEGETQP